MVNTLDVNPANGAGNPNSINNTIGLTTKVIDSDSSVVLSDDTDTRCTISDVSQLLWSNATSYAKSVGYSLTSTMSGGFVGHTYELHSLSNSVATWKLMQPTGGESSGNRFSVTFTAGGGTSTEGSSYSGTLTQNGTTLEYDIASSSSSGSYYLLSGDNGSFSLELTITVGSNGASGSAPNFDQTKIWILRSPTEYELDRWSPPSLRKKVFCNFW